MSVQRTPSSVDLMPNVSTQFHIITANVLVDLFHLERNVFMAMTMSHVETYV